MRRLLLPVAGGAIAEGGLGEGDFAEIGRAGRTNFDAIRNHDVVGGGAAGNTDSFAGMGGEALGIHGEDVGLAAGDDRGRDAAVELLADVGVHGAAGG